MGKGYYITKCNKHKDIVYIDYDKISGYDIKPKNTNKYGITVNKMIIVKPSMIEKLLIKKTKTKLDMFIQKILFLLEDDDSSDGALREALNDMTRYKNIINYKYRKYLEDKYVENLNKKVSVLEQELKRKILYNNKSNIQDQMYQNMYYNPYQEYEEEKATNRTR